MRGPKREGKKGTRLLGEILSREKGAGFPGQGKQPVLAKEKRQTEREGGPSARESRRKALSGVPD